MTPVMEEGLFVQVYRVGEASNPGPYSVGGASSSASHLALGHSVVASSKKLAAGEPPVLKVANQVVSTAGSETPMGMLPRDIAVSSFDNADDWNFAEEPMGYSEEVCDLLGAGQDYRQALMSPNLQRPEEEEGQRSDFWENY